MASAASPLTMRFKYGGLLVISFVLSVVMRSDKCLDAAKYMKFGYLDECRGEHQCLKDQPCYRIAFATALFFTIHWLVSNSYNCVLRSPASRVRFNTDWFVVKVALLVALMVGSLFTPSNGFFVVFAWAALVLSFVYLVLQLVIFLGFSYDLNDWLRNHDHSAARVGLIGGTVVMNLATLTGTGFMYHWFGDDSSCSIGQMMITLTLLSAVGYTILGVFTPNGSLFPSAIVFLYTSWTIFTALSSGITASETCNRLSSEPASWKLGISGALSALSLAYACTAGGMSRGTIVGDTETKMNGVNMNDNLSGAENGLTASANADVSYDDEQHAQFASQLSWFHLLMALGSFYMSMLVTNWYITKGEGSAASSSSIAEVDSGATSMWIKFASTVLCILLYVWTLIAPWILRNRDFS